MKIPTGLTAHAILPTPLGPLTAAASARGLALLDFDLPPLPLPREDPGHPWLAQVAAELRRYWQDPRTAFEVPLDLQGTPFQCAVWQALRTLASGRTCSYGEIARRIGRPRAVRAVGAANGANPVVIIVPCHRVIGADGSLTGYSSGIGRKVALLQHESTVDPPCAG